MIKAVELIVFIVLLFFSFFLGVKYSDSIKNNVVWLQTKSDDDVELPDLSNEPETNQEDLTQNPDSPPSDNIQPAEQQFNEPVDNSYEGDPSVRRE